MGENGENIANLLREEADPDHPDNNRGRRVCKSSQITRISLHRGRIGRTGLSSGHRHCIYNHIAWEKTFRYNQTRPDTAPGIPKIAQISLRATKGGSLSFF